MINSSQEAIDAFEADVYGCIWAGNITAEYSEFLGMKSYNIKDKDTRSVVGCVYEDGTVIVYSPDDN